MKKVNIGMIGLGTVGLGTYKILMENRDIISKRTGLDIEVSKIYDRSFDKKAQLNSIPSNKKAESADDIINDSDISIVVEAIGGMEPAATYISRSLESGKSVVTPNKAVVAEHFQLFTQLAKEHNAQLAFEASVGGAIPAITAVLEPLSANRFTEIMGILNGTTNYILTQMAKGMTYADALAIAQEKGFAEADPTADVEGIDAANKLSILMAIAMDRYVKPADIPREGITKVTLEDIESAKKEGKVIKLIAKAAISPEGELLYSVKPEAIDQSHPLGGVNEEFNAIYVTGDMSGQLMFYGKGAGSLPTGSAVVGDIIKLAKNV